MFLAFELLCLVVSGELGIFAMKVSAKREANTNN